MNDKLIIHYNVDSSINAFQFGKALASTSVLYKKYLKKDNASLKITEDESRLYISSVSNNCILCEFIPATISILPSIESALNIGATMFNMVFFLQRVKKIYTEIPEEKYAQQELQTIPTNDLKIAKDIISVASNNGKILGEVDIQYENFTDGSKSCSIRFSPQEVQKTSQGIEKTLKYRASRKNEYIASAKLQLVQFNKEIDCTREDGHTGDRGRIKEISPSPLPIIWGQESIANNIKTQDVNPTKKIYIVSVHVQRDSKNKPIAYNITELKDSYTPRIRRRKKNNTTFLPGFNAKKRGK